MIGSESAGSAILVDRITLPLIETAQIVSERSMPHEDDMSRTRATIIIATVASMTSMNSMLSGMLTVALPRIAKDLALKENLLLW